MNEDQATQALSIRQIIAGIRDGKDGAQQALYQRFGRAIRRIVQGYVTCRNADSRLVESCVGTIVDGVVASIVCGDLVDPSLVPTFIRSRIRRLLGTTPRRVAITRPQDVVEIESTLLAEILESLPSHEREALVWFYTCNKSEARICADMGFTVEEFRAMRAAVRGSFAVLSSPESDVALRATAPRGAGRWM